MGGLASIPIMSSIIEMERYKDFFSAESVVLGLDIGIEGIGITVRRGKEWLYSRSLLVDLPEAKALEKRRLFRAARRTRKNRRVRMRRLAMLFEKHGLPWVSDDVYARSDPYMLRHRALKGRLASKEALSLCIRSCVAHRGYDYTALSREEGEDPWGSGNGFSDAKKWLSTAYVDKALQVADLHGSTEPRQPMRVLRYSRGCAIELLCRCRYFQVERLLLNTAHRECGVGLQTRSNSFQVLLCTDGTGRLVWEGQEIDFHRGDCIFVPADSVPFALWGKAQLL